MARFYLILLVLLVLFTAVILSSLHENWWRHLLKKRDVAPLKLALWERGRYIRRCRNAFLTAAFFFVGAAAGLILSDRYNSGSGSSSPIFLLFSLGFPVLIGLSVIVGFYYLVLALKKPAKTEAGLPAFLMDAPGPFPWYLNRKPVSQPSRKEELFWDAILLKTAKDASAGALKSRAGDVYGLISSGVYVKSGAGSRFLSWEQAKTTVEGREKEMVRFRVVEADRLAPIADIESGMKEMEETGNRTWFPGGETGAILIPASLPEGIYSREFPQVFHEFGELILFVANTVPEGSLRRKEELKLWIIYPAVGTLEVISQEWYSQASLTRGKPVPVRVSRDPASGAVYCEVIRLGVFSLNESRKKIGEFLIDDRHYTPQVLPSQKKAVNSALK
ncbi:MAG TPA: hypothetical protein VN944_00795 [Nitrospiria bacterium]|nr:hypothetical protein [Nitrospiria bacterium]